MHLVELLADGLQFVRAGVAILECLNADVSRRALLLQDAQPDQRGHDAGDARRHDRPPGPRDDLVVHHSAAALRSGRVPNHHRTRWSQVR